MTEAPSPTYVPDLKTGDLITDGFGLYRVTRAPEPTGRGWYREGDNEIWHIPVTTIAGYVLGGFIRSRFDRFMVMPHVEPDPGSGVEGISDAKETAHA